MTTPYDLLVQDAKYELEKQPAVISSAMGISIKAATDAWLRSVLSERNRLRLFLNGMEKSFNLPIEEAAQLSAMELILAENNIKTVFDL